MDKKRFIYILFFPIVLFIFLFGYGPQSEADSIDTFDAVAQFPENQIDPALSYFDLMMEPGQEEQVMVHLYNRTEEELKLNVSFHRAITNSGGVIEYSGMNRDTGTSFPANIEDLVTINEKTVTIPASGEKEISLSLKMPEEAFDGVLAGGLYMEQLPEGEMEGNIRNVFSREIALLLRTNDKKITPELTLNQAEASQNNHRNLVEVAIENPTPAYVSRVAVDYQILKGEREVLRGSQENMSIAPNTVFPYHVYMQGQTFEPGEYVIKTKVTSNNQEWQKDLAFTVEADQARALNQQDVTVSSQENQPPWLMIALGAVLVLLVGLVVYLLIRNKRLSKR